MGQRYAGVEPDNLAGITGFIIPPPSNANEVTFFYDTHIFLNKATIKKRIVVL